ncbi:MAG: multiheme c-type cytochrome [Desulfobacterales bacterium]|jgi:predicted CXXCH cytochrome family protein
MTSWKLTGIVATLLMVLSIPIYLYRTAQTGPSGGGPASETGLSFVGSGKCSECHRVEYDNWRGSHHDLAMDLATEESVLGDFDEARFEHFGSISRFFRRDGRFFVHTQGPGGVTGDFEVTHTFGAYPLQQYLVPFPGGRLQCLPIAWDVREKRWYHLYPDAALDPGDWLYWTNAGQNWNGMCAECHSTNLKKNYDLDTDSYRTTWSEIDVACEACHGPGSAHVDWAELPDMARPETPNSGLAARTSGLDSREAVELCAPCHSRRAILGDYTHTEDDLLDTMLPSLLTEGLYFPDGQILDEVYVYGSFTQSKMYHREVRCSDCHDVHSVKTVKTGNALCLQCHQAAVYDRKAHHFHKREGEDGEPIRSPDGSVLFDVGTGSSCVQCHMPGRTYMGIDYRPDHSFRVPRPDLALRLGTPDPCIRCHVDKSSLWADETITRWYGPGRSTHYGEILSKGREGVPASKEGLIRLAGDPLYPVIVRATALNLLRRYPGEDTDQAFETGLADEEALIRRTAAGGFDRFSRDRRLAVMMPSLADPVKAVRIEAARQLAELPDKGFDADQKARFDDTLAEYRKAMAYSGDFSFGRFNLANLEASLGQTDAAVDHYLAAIRIDNQFYPAKVNLAMLYNRLGNNADAERLLREALAIRSDLFDVHYSLGLLLAEEKKYLEAARHLDIAAEGMPDQPRIYYNLGMLLDYLGEDGRAEAAFRRAYRLDGENADTIKALVAFYAKRQRFDAIERLAETILEGNPSSPLGEKLLEFSRRSQDGGG